MRHTAMTQPQLPRSRSPHVTGLPRRWNAHAGAGSAEVWTGRVRDKPPLHSVLRASERHLIAHAVAGAGFVMRREQCRPPHTPRVRQRSRGDAPSLFLGADDLHKAASLPPPDEIAVNGFTPIGELVGGTDGERACLPAVGNSTGLPVGWEQSIAPVEMLEAASWKHRITRIWVVGGQN